MKLDNIQLECTAGDSRDKILIEGRDFGFYWLKGVPVDFRPDFKNLALLNKWC